MTRKALITGIRGQDGAYLAKHLLEEGYEVYGADRRSGDTTFWRLEAMGIRDDVKILYMDLLELTNIIAVLRKVQPDEIYNLAAQSFVATSFDQPMVTTDVNAMGTLRILEAMRVLEPATRFYQASTSEMFGKVAETPQSERTPFHPRSPYGVAKLYAHWITVNYREAYDLFACSGILFNHESPLRGIEFVTRKITRAVAAMAKGRVEPLVLGNIDARRDWGFAGDYVRGMHAMLQHEQADDYVLATGETRSIRDFLDAAFAIIDRELVWEGEGLATRGIDRKKGDILVTISEEFYRPAEVDVLQGDASKAHQRLGWKPSVNFEGLVEMMVRADLDMIR